MTGPNGPTVIIGPETGDSLSKAVPEALQHFRIALSAGVPWHIALLEAMASWTLPEETFQGRVHKYMVGGEAFDWLLLAQRLCADVDGLILAEEEELLLLNGLLPEHLSDEEFRDLIGVSKYRAYLNYHYGIVLEEALQLDAEEDTRKRHTARGYADSEEFLEEAFAHLYGRPRAELLDQFRREAKMDRRRGLSLTDLKEFTYWLHKRRISLWDPARVASDTRKAIKRYDALRGV